MPYRGDYYHRGDYRRGDPGLFGFLGGLAKKALGFVPGIGPIAAAVGGAAVPALLHKREQQIATGQLEPNWLGRHVLPHLTSTQPIGSSMAGTPHGRITRGSGGPGMAVATTDGAPRGYHLIRHGPNAGGFAKNRRMNWANPHALGRAERRIHSAVKHFTRYIRWVHPKREGHAAPKFKAHRGKKK